MKLNQQKGQVDLMLLGLFITVAGLILVVAAIISSEIRHQKMLEENDCSLYSEVETGEDVYCGKACWRPEVKRTYMCRGGWYEELV